MTEVSEFSTAGEDKTKPRDVRQPRAGVHEFGGRDLTLEYDGFTVSKDLTVDIPIGKVTSIIGANGCGKSTLLRALSRLLAPKNGYVYLDGDKADKVPRKQFARTVGLLPQNPIAPEGIIVSDLVECGRQPYRSLLGRLDHADDTIVRRAMEKTSTYDLADRPVDELSGGQRQRVWIAMVLAQDTDILLLDEPTTFLDIANQLEVLEVIAQRNREEGTTVVMVLHDMNLASRYSDHIIAVKDGAIVAQGEPQDVFTVEGIREVFGIESHIGVDPVSGAPHVFPFSSQQTPQ